MEIGTDIVKLKRMRIDKLFLTKILTKEEISIFSKIIDNNQKLRFLAGKWAIKEALYKANNDNFNFSKLHLYKVNNRIRLKGKELDYLISVSYESEYCLAFVLYLKNS